MINKALYLSFLTTLSLAQTTAAQARDPIAELMELAAFSPLERAVNASASTTQAVKAQLIQQAFRNGHHERMSEVIRALIASGLMNFHDLNQLLYNASDVTEAKVYLEAGADPDFEVADKPLLVHALHNERYDMSDMLLRYGADRSSYLENFYSLMQPGIIKYAIKKDLLRGTDRVHRQAVYSIILPMDRAIALELLREDVEATLREKDVPSEKQLLAAIRLEDADLFLELLSAGADLFYQEPVSQATVVFLQALSVEKIRKALPRDLRVPERASAYLINMLLTHSLSPDAGIPMEEMWLLLIDMGLPLTPSRYHTNSLEIAASGGFIKLAEILINTSQYSVDHKDQQGYTMLDLALHYGQFRMAEFFEKEGATKTAPVLVVTTNEMRNGVMYRQALAEFSSTQLNAATLAFPSAAHDGNATLSEIRDFLSHLRANENRPRAVIHGDLKIVREVVDFARSAFKYADGIWLTGGVDVWPEWYRPGHALTEPQDIYRDLMEFAILDLQEQHPYKPLMGVCRGNQITNVFHGGTLRNWGEQGTKPLVMTQRSGFLGAPLGQKAKGLSAHSQSIDSVAPNLEVAALSREGMVKGIVASEKGLPLFGTQFHPEFEASSRGTMSDTSQMILNRFVNAVLSSSQNQCADLQ